MRVGKLCYFGWTILSIYSYMERDFRAMGFYCGRSCKNPPKKQTPIGPQNVWLIVTLWLCTWLAHIIVRTHCVVDTCLELLVGFWGTFRWNVESPRHISQWTPFCDRKRNTQLEAIRIKAIGHDCSKRNSTYFTFFFTSWTLHQL